MDKLRRIFGLPLLYWGAIVLYTAFMSLFFVLRWTAEQGVSVWFPLAAAAVALGTGWLCKRRSLPVLPQQNILWGLTLLCILYVFCCNIGAFVVPSQMHISVFMTMGTMLVLWGLLRYGALLFWAPFLLLQFAQFAAYEQYATRLNSLVIAEAMEASDAEFSAYMSTGNVVLLLLVLVAIAVMLFLQVWLLKKVRSRMTSLAAGGLFFFLAFAGAWLVPQNEMNEDAFWPTYTAYHLEESVREAFYHNQQTVSIAEELHSPAEKASSISTLNGTEGVVLVLHIGESVRADRMSINGYERDTTPWLRSRTDLINFPRCISAAHDTCQAQIALLTNARRDIHTADAAMKPTAGSVLDLFRANGFRVYAFFGRRVGQQLKYDRVVRLLTRCAEERFNAPESPWTSIPQIQAVLQSNPQTANLVLFVNNEGSHTPFYHFDEATAPFKPYVREFENPGDHAQEVNNAYDNTIHYTDEFIRRVVSLLQGRPFVYVYVSDHGEYLGHNGMWGRGALGEKEGLYHETTGCCVGMFVLASPEFRALHPHFESALQRMSKNAALQVGHEHLFHSLLGLFGIQSPYYDSQLDLSSEGVLPYTGPAPAADAE